MASSRRCPGVPLAVAAGLLLSACSPFGTSDYANCVVAESESSYTGEKLLHDGSASAARRATIACAETDEEIDGGDGPERGRVRWVVCSKGPDCDEAGMF